MHRKDPLTGEIFEPKRVTQKFANPKNRIKYHNQKAGELKQSLSFINKPLMLNFKILNEIMSNKDSGLFLKRYLVGKGFSFSVFTHHEFHQDKLHYAIYQYMLIPVSENQIQIINKNG